MNAARAFIYDETGAVAVDWVVLTAGVVGIAISFMTPISSAISDMAVYIADTIGEYHAFLPSSDQ